MASGRTAASFLAISVIAALRPRSWPDVRKGFGRPGGFILAVVCSAGIVYLIRRSRERRVGPATTTATRWR